MNFLFKALVFLCFAFVLMRSVPFFSDHGVFLLNSGKKIEGPVYRPPFSSMFKVTVDGSYYLVDADNYVSASYAPSKDVHSLSFIVFNYLPFLGFILLGLVVWFKLFNRHMGIPPDVANGS